MPRATLANIWGGHVSPPRARHWELAARCCETRVSSFARTKRSSRRLEPSTLISALVAARWWMRNARYTDMRAGEWMEEETRILGGFLVDARNCFAGGRGISFFPIFFRLGWRNIVFKRNCGWVINYWDVDLKLGGYGVRFSVRNLWYFISWKFYEVKCVKRKEHLSNIMYIMFKSSNRNYLK